ncbi:NACHT domain- and WD repeat-containing protein 1-like [Oculina patagonica]
MPSHWNHSIEQSGSPIFYPLAISLGTEEKAEDRQKIEAASLKEDPRLGQKTIRIFLSSTFTDTREDRNSLLERVFEPIREDCQKLGIALEVVDLRWGVRDESVDDHRVLDICMEEIKRCQDKSLGYTFIAILGDRYGTRPLPSSIDADEFERLLEWIDQSDDELTKSIKFWYRRDDNTVPPCYLLQPISTMFHINSVDKDESKKAWLDWFDVVKKIRNQLWSAAEKAGLEEDKKQKYMVSMTQMEVEKGVVSDPNARHRTLVIDRRFDHITETDEAAGKFINLQENEERLEIDTECSELLKELKERRILKVLDSGPGGQILQFHNLNWHPKGLQKEKHSDYLEEMCNRVKDLLSSHIKNIRKDLEKLDSRNPSMEDLELEVTRHALFCSDRARLFKGRDKILKDVHNYVTESNPGMPLVIHGESGVGKTSLMAKVAMEIEEKSENRNLAIMYRFCGTTPDSSTGRSLTESLCKQLKRVYQINEEVPEDYESLCEVFPALMAHASKERPLCIVIDSLDQLTDEYGARRFLKWLPRKLPAHACMIVSTLPDEGGCMECLKTFPAVQFLQVKRLEVHDGHVILDAWLKSVNRKLTEKQRAQVLEAFYRCPLPLYLRLLFIKCSSWPSYKETTDITLEPDVTGMIHTLYQGFEKYHGEMFVGRVVGLLATRPDGMNSDEILNILSCDEELLKDVLDRHGHDPPKRRLPALMLARLKYDLGPFLVERGAYGVSLLALYHRQFLEVARERYLNGDRHRETHSSIAKYFSGEYHGKYGNERAIPAQPHAYSSVALNFRKLDRLPIALLEARDFNGLRSILGDLKFVQAKCMAGMGHELLAETTKAVMSCSANEQADPEIINITKDLRDIMRFLRREIHILRRSPILAYQQAATYPPQGWIAKEAERIRLNFKQPDPNNIPTPEGWIEWMNKTQVPEAFELELGGHSQSVLSTCFLKDNRTLFSGSADGAIRVWDSQTGELQAQLEFHQGPVTCVRRSPNGAVMASASADKTIRLWNFPASESSRALKGHEDRVTCIAFSKSGDKLLSTSKDNTLKLWDLNTGDNLKTLLAGHKHYPVSCAWSPLDDSVGASCGDNLELFLWDLKECSVRITLQGHKRDDNPDFQDKDTLEGLRDLDYKSLVWSVCFSPDGKYLASAGVDSDVILWDVKTGVKICTFNLPNDASTVAFARTAHGTRLAAGSSAHHTVTLFDATFDDVSGELVSSSSRTLGSHSDWVIDMAFTDDGSRLASASCDKSVRVWDVRITENLPSTRFHSERCWSVAFSYDGKWLASASDDFKVYVWDVETFEVSRIYEGHEHIRTYGCGVRACTFSRGSTLIASGGDELKIRIWYRETGEDKIVLDCGESMLPWCLRFSPDDKLLVSVGEKTKGAIVWDLETKAQILILEGHTKICQYTEFSPSGKFILTSSKDNSARIWNSKSFKHVATVTQPDWVTCATFSHNEQLLATCSKDQLVRLWNTSTWKQLCEMKGHESEIRMVSFSPDDKFLASGALDQTIRIWDCDTHQQIQVFYAASGIWGLAWHPTKHDLLAAGDAVGYLYLLQICNVNKIEKIN